METSLANQPGRQKNNTQDNYTKGGIFEWYIVRLFNSQHFKTRKWYRSKTTTDLQSLFDYGNPDLQIELVFTGNKKYQFAVECKWRAGFKDGKIQWADKEKIERYKKFQGETGMTVFVAIGVGGQPGSPERLFVTPLDEIAGCEEVYESKLIEFKRKVTGKFYFDYRQLRLF